MLFTSHPRRKQRAGYAHKSAHLSKLCECGLINLVVRVQVRFLQIPCSVVNYYAPHYYNLNLKDVGFLAH